MAGTVALVLFVLMATIWYGRRQLVHVSLTTDQPPLAAELRDEAGRLAALRTVPTQETVDIPAGEYRLQVSGWSVE